MIKKFAKLQDNQIQQVLPQLSNRPTLITVTAGIDDTDWSNNLTTAFHALEPDTLFYHWLYGLTTEIQDDLETELTPLANRPNIAIVLTDYHDPFNPDSVFFYPKGVPACAFVLPGGGGACYQRIETAVSGLNTAITGAALVLAASDSLQTQAVDLRDVFQNASGTSHNSPMPACGNAPPKLGDTWIQYPGDRASNAGLPAGARGWYPNLPSYTTGDCFHPNKRGAQTYADTVAQAGLVLLHQIITGGTH